MKKGKDATSQPATCGTCGQTIRMRGDANSVLCTAILDVVPAENDTVCEHYIERSEEQAEDAFTLRF